MLMSETRHYTKDTHDSPVSKMRRIWCEDCRVVVMHLSEQMANGNSLHLILKKETS